MTPAERSRRYRKQLPGFRKHTSVDISIHAHHELQRIAGQSGLSSTGVLLVAIHKLSSLPPEEIAALAPLVARVYGQRIEFTDPDGKLTRVSVGEYRRGR